MPKDDIIQIKVDRHSIGIIGLKDVIETVAKDFVEKPDTEIIDELLKQLARKNYIPANVRENYGKAFLREFNKYLGRPYEEEVYEGLEINVLGPGCPECDRLNQKLMEVMAEMDIAGNIEHITNIKKIGEYGVMGTPALLINGKVKSVGSVPPKSKLIDWLKEAQETI